MTSFARAPLNVAADDPVAVDGVVVTGDRQRLWCAIAVKATYRLTQDECVLEARSLPIYFEDQPQDPAAGKGISRPCDLDPMKHAAEVVVVGSAFASVAPVDHVVARIVVGEIDKSVETWVQRRYRADGSLESKGTANRFPLDFTVAAGGPGSDNPSGVNVERVDSKGRRRVPQLLPPGFVLGGPGAFVPVAGLGALGAESPIRQRHLRVEDRAWLADPSALPPPSSLDTRYFQSTLPDQWLGRPVSASEWLVLEQLHPRHARITTRLPGIEPRAYAYGQPLSLRAELMVIDTDLGIVTLTWRGRCDLDPSRPSVPLVIQMAQGAAPAPAPVPSARPPSPLSRPPQTADDHPQRDIALDTTGIDIPGVIARPSVEAGKLDALPFATPSAHGRHGRGSFSDNALPFRDTPPAPVASRTPSPPPPAPAPAPPAPSQPQHVPPAPVSYSSPPASLGGLGGLGTPSPRGPSALRSAPPPPISSPGVAAPPPALLPAPPPPPASLRAERPAPSADPQNGFGAAFGPVRAAVLPVGGRDDGGAAKKASDLAAERERERNGAPQRTVPQKDDGSLRRRAAVDVLGFDPSILRRIRSRPPHAATLKALRAGRRSGASLDAPVAEEEDRDRTDVLRIFSYGRPMDLAEARRAIDAAFDDDQQLDPPLLLLSGEARPVFDEIESLRTMMAIAQPLAPTDKRMLSAVGMATEALAANPPPSADKALSLMRQIEQATSSLSLPPKFVSSQVERSLLESRKFKKRQLWGAQRFRADIALGTEPLPCYVDDSLSAQWPLLPVVTVIVLAEIRPREDAGETSPEAIFVRALGRVLSTRGPAGAV